MATIFKTDNTKWWWACGAKGILIDCQWECKNSVATVGDGLAVSYVS